MNICSPEGRGLFDGIHHDELVIKVFARFGLIRGAIIKFSDTAAGHRLFFWMLCEVVANETECAWNKLVVRAKPPVDLTCGSSKALV